MHDIDAYEVPASAAEGGGTVAVRTRPADADDAHLVHALYAATPGYFEIISIPVPTTAEVRTELAAAARDERRRVELVLADPAAQPPPGVPHDPRSGCAVLAYLDYKLDYPEPGDATVNLLLVHGDLQTSGIGTAAVLDLERRLQGSMQRVLASIYGRNPAARRFWQRLGYHFAIDARPILDWYAKQLTP